MSDLVNLAATIGDRFTTNISNSVSSLTAQQWIRIIVVACGYMLLRPYVLKLGARQQMKQHERDEADAEERARVTPNEIRGFKVVAPVPEDSDSDDGGSVNVGGAGARQHSSSATDWGKKARRRQRQLVKKIMADHERLLEEQQEDDEDKDIQEFLVD